MSVINTNLKLQFSGHESFSCKQFWLKKGYDFVQKDKTFNDDEVVIDLGVGKNMVSSIRYWCKAFNIIDEKDDTPTELGNYIFSDNGYDPYLEDIGTLWLLHYNLIKKNKASLYSLLFNEFRKERIDFTKEHLHSFLKRKCNEDKSVNYSEKTITTDINVFFRNYASPERKAKVDVEDVFSNIFLDLQLIHQYKKIDIDGKIEDWYKIGSEKTDSLPSEIVLYSIIDNYEDKTISFKQLLTGTNSPGNIFALNAEELYKHILNISNKYASIIYSETAGNRTLQFKEQINKWEILNEYYR
ncbi:DUF4007 family protein [Epilithonimonas sp. UC225_85]|uniref:DUF4007 family protein n=1 Tax=Epilithonimonas sp. UC225_85 TaxID=3350167 RepID=UPI0036D2DC39